MPLYLVITAVSINVIYDMTTLGCTRSAIWHSQQVIDSWIRHPKTRLAQLMKIIASLPVAAPPWNILFYDVSLRISHLSTFTMFHPGSHSLQYTRRRSIRIIVIKHIPSKQVARTTLNGISAIVGRLPFRKYILGGLSPPLIWCTSHHLHVTVWKFVPALNDVIELFSAETEKEKIN